MHKKITKQEIIKKNLSVYLGVKTFLAVVLATVVSIKYLDAEIAVRVMHFIQSIYLLKKVTNHIPDLLLHFVIIATILMWAVYFYRLQKNKYDVETKFLQLAATVLPAAYLAKTLLKFIFGRTSPRTWYAYSHHSTFHWFKYWSSSFPSGHMVVFAAFGAAILIYYPQYQRWVLTFLVLLGLALVGTDYHFLSDVIAGAYLGIVTAYFVWYILEKMKIRFK